MSQNVAPWLQGLDDSDIWEIPAAVQQRQTTTSSQTTISSASHDADSLRRNSLSRIPRRSISGRRPSIKGSAHASIQRRRNPLSALSDSNNNSLRHSREGRTFSKSRSFSANSEESVLQYDTVQQRSKSASPRKQDTMEWKRRLLNGKVGYGDQTDLFGPSGLENIFAKAQPTGDAPRKTRSSLTWMDKSAFVSMPSSPPPWPSRVSEERDDSEQHDTVYGEERLTTVDEEHENRSPDYPTTADDSYLSNPFDIGLSEGPVIEESEPQVLEDLSESSPKHPEPTQDNIVGNRTVSGQTEVSGFSPVIMAKHTVDGKVQYKPMESRIIKQFQNGTVDLKHPSQQYAEESDEAGEESDFTDGPENESPAAVPDFSLSEALSTGTPPVPSLGTNIQLKRGGYSAHGSFKDRLLSASQSIVEPSINRDSSGFLSPMPSTGHPLPSAPTPPGQLCTPGRTDRDEPRSRSSGSPLKLFGPHDTFTSNRLLRRMSQLDPDLSNIRSDDESQSATGLQQEFQPTRNISSGSFGNGELNDYGFNAEITITGASDSDKGDSDRSPGSEVPPPGSKSPFGFRLENFQGQPDTSRLKRKLSKRSGVGSKESTLSASTRNLQPTVEDASEVPAPIVHKNHEIPIPSGKRPPNSPFKAPTPKRRRTLHAEDLLSDASQVNRSYHDQLQDAVASRKRRESRRGPEQCDAEEAILAQRKILRPRNPTPSQRRREQIEAEIRETAEQFAIQEPGALEAVMEQIESSIVDGSPPSIQQQAQVFANEVAKFSLRIQKASGEHTERKRSVTTQDFFNEAVMVMRLIREKAGRTSGLGSVAESDQEAVSDGVDMDNSAQELSSLRLSRPPSREGISGWRPRTSEQTDARVISHLRKFQENDDTEFIAQSIESLHVDDEEEDFVAVDEHSNIRIKGPLTFQNEPEDDPSRPSTQHSQQSSVASQETQNSAASSTGRTFISRKSDNVGTLAPDAVAHLIGEQVGAMTYNKDKQQWVKVKSPQKRQHGSFLEPPSNITSDDDPFREISDLRVDTQKEEEIRKASSGRRPSATPADYLQAKAEEDAIEKALESRTTSQETVLARPGTRDSHKSRHTYSSSDPSRDTGLASSQHHTVETRATSWGTEELERLSAPGMAKQQPLAHAAAQAILALAQQPGDLRFVGQHHDETEYSLPPPPIPTMNNPIPDSTEEEPVDESRLSELNEHARLREDTLAGAEVSEIEDITSPKLRQATHLTGHHRTTRQVSLRRKTLTSKFSQADIMEQSELSFVAPLPGERMMSVSLSVSRPISQRQPLGHVLQVPSSPIKYDDTKILSDLPEFTLHGEDLERPTERALAQRLAKHAAAEVDDRYALAVKDLVKTLTDVKAEEPYWEDLKQLDLSQRSMSSVHGLDEFCCNVQDIDLSDNKLAYLNGVPSTTRQLLACQNQLSTLTPWTHLMNLQYLDISGNQLQNLHGLACLIHLRELRADDNAIDSLEGIMGLDGLLKLRARRNVLTDVDLTASSLHRLEALDLSDNALATVRGIHALQALNSLALDNNPLLEGPEVLESMPELRQLSLRDCGIRDLDVTRMPNLRTLILDGNSLSHIKGIEELKSLEMLSLRRQIFCGGAQMTVLEQEVHARTICLSENDIPALRPPHSLLSLQHLEVASCGLQELADDFGLRFPNLQSLNLNFNSLRDVRPLLNIQKLERLSVCGNRLERLRKTVATLSKMPTLISVDLRDNHLTLGFYPPHSCASVQTSVVRRSVPAVAEGSDDLERIAAAKYAVTSSDPQQDETHTSRLDESTKLKKRVYQLLLGSGCLKLKSLDGMPFSKGQAMVKDGIWRRLVELGIVRKSGGLGVTVREEVVG